ncbi:MAG: DUF1080 domain-containing protein [Bacteroidota bacterium]|nr:DUF1080 domain-containing protein [Bacteroidota bacterium]
MYLSKSLLSGIIITATVSTILVGCDSGNQNNTTQSASDTTSNASASDLQKVNALSGQEKEEGWELLFNGNSTDSWKGYRKEVVPEGWVINDDALHFTGESGAGDIITKNEYENFELALEWKIIEGGNSGIFFNVVEDEKYDAVYHTGPEMQILDDERHPDAKQNPGKRIAGSNYDLYEPSAKARPAGEWNQARLVKNNNKVEHWMNGEKVVEYELGSDKWKKDVKNSKFVEMPDYGLAQKGHIALQDHGDKVWFRNIKIRKL